MTERTLVVMRHAKAERGDGKADIDRACEPRGMRDAASVGEQLADLGFTPDLVLCSAARRTRDTLAALLPHFPGDCRVELTRALYDAEVSDLREAVRTARGNRIILIGHNPSVHGFAVLLAGRSPDAEALTRGFPTSSAALFGLGFAPDSAHFRRLVSP